MRYLILSITIFTIIGCSGNTETETLKIYSMEDISSAGLKAKGEFKTSFPEATDSKWGFLKGREVAFIRYPSPELAKINGLKVAEEQTKKIEIIERNIAHGKNVEKLICRGYKPGVGVAGRGGLKLSSNLNSKNSLEGTLIINKAEIFIKEDILANEAPPCVRREPLYTHFKIHGNLVIMVEPLNTEDDSDTVKFVKSVSNLLP